MNEKTDDVDFYQLNKHLYTIPKWAQTHIPPTGYKLQIYKGTQLINTIDIDRKPFFYFGRQFQQVDIPTEHASCSRVHAILLYHHKLEKWYLVDLKSVHGTFVGKTRLDPMTPIPINSEVSFRLGASTRQYKLYQEQIPSNETNHNDQTYLSDNEDPYDEKTKKNTIYNKMLHLHPFIDNCEYISIKRKPNNHQYKVNFKSNVEIINPEEIDPTIGRYRNMVRQSVLYNNDKRKHKIDTSALNKAIEEPCKFDERFSVKKYEKEKWPHHIDNTI